MLVLLIDIVQIVNDYIDSPLAKRVNAYYFIDIGVTR
jgi:hypothetical protein